MRTSVFIGTSLDGFIARPTGALDFLDVPDMDDGGYTAFAATVDALVMGRNTYDVVLTFGQWPYGDKPVFVLSSREIPVPSGAKVERLSGSPAEIVAQLDARGYQHLYVDGGITVQRFLDAGLIDRLIVTRVPVLIGQGIPLFGPVTRDIRLSHVETRTLAGGLVQSEYLVVRSGD
jgi:dihydrofolate reductase